MHYFIVLVIISVCVKCFNIFWFVSSWYFCCFDIDVCSTCTFFDCQVDFDVDNVQRCELVDFYGI